MSTSLRPLLSRTPEMYEHICILIKQCRLHLAVMFVTSKWIVCRYMIGSLGLNKALLRCKRAIQRLNYHLHYRYLVSCTFVDYCPGAKLSKGFNGSRTLWRPENKNMLSPCQSIARVFSARSRFRYLKTGSYALIWEQNVFCLLVVKVCDSHKALTMWIDTVRAFMQVIFDLVFCEFVSHI